jgi:hypothetical protein
MNHFTPAQRKKLNKPALAAKHECSEAYIRLVLRGERDDHSELAKRIIADAKKMLAILEPKQENNV